MENINIDRLISSGYNQIKNMFNLNSDDSLNFLDVWSAIVLKDISSGASNSKDQNNNLCYGFFCAGSDYPSNNIRRALTISGISKSGNFPKSCGVATETLMLTPEIQIEAKGKLDKLLENLQARKDDKAEIILECFKK